MLLALVVQVENLRGSPPALFVVAVTAVHGNALPFTVRRPNDLFNLVFVVGDDAVGGIDDVLRRPVVLLEFVEGKIRVVLLEVEDVLDVGAAETVNRLGVVTDDTEVLTQGRELLDDEVLGEVGVLVLVHQDV